MSPFGAVGEEAQVVLAEGGVVREGREIDQFGAGGVEGDSGRSRVISVAPGIALVPAVCAWKAKKVPGAASIRSFVPRPITTAA